MNAELVVFLVERGFQATGIVALGVDGAREFEAGGVEFAGGFFEGGGGGGFGVLREVAGAGGVGFGGGLGCVAWGLEGA